MASSPALFSLSLFFAFLIWNESKTNLLVSGQVPEIPEIGATPYGTCGDCYCIPEEGESCPGENPDVGVKTANRDDIEDFKSQRAINPIILGCNPFNNEFCDTQPPRQFRYDLDPDASAKAVCGILYKMPRFGCPKEYALVSYPDVEAAKKARAVVTHHGACGVCSATQDLAVMMTTRDFNSLIAQCTFRFVLQGINIKNFINCVEDLGITPDCAKMLYWASSANTDACVDECARDATSGREPQGPPPECDLSPCVQCAADKNGDFSRSFLGRLPTNSDILSAFAPRCSDLPNITHNACPDFDEDPVFPTSPPSESIESGGHSRTSRWHETFFLVSICCSMLWMMF